MDENETVPSPTDLVLNEEQKAAMGNSTKNNEGRGLELSEQAKSTFSTIIDFATRLRELTSSDLSSDEQDKLLSDVRAFITEKRSELEGGANPTVQQSEDGGVDSDPQTSSLVQGLTMLQNVVLTAEKNLERSRVSAQNVDEESGSDVSSASEAKPTTRKFSLGKLFPRLFR